MLIQKEEQKRTKTQLINIKSKIFLSLSFFLLTNPTINLNNFKHFNKI